MSLSLCILASGSSGNCAIVRCSDRSAVLIDAGLSPRRTAERLAGTGVGIDDIDAICLTHLDGDHFHRGWLRQIETLGIRLFTGPQHRRSLLGITGDSIAHLVVEIDSADAFKPAPGIVADAIDLNHDDAGSHGFVFASSDAQIAWATDLGRVPQRLIDRFAGADIVALESNYDRRMQVESTRPQFLKNRIMNGRGHLSNDEAFAAIRRILDRSDELHRRLPSHVVLLHRSDECNCPNLVRELFSRDPRLVDRLVLAEQHCRGEWLCPVARPPCLGQQLTLGW